MPPDTTTLEAGTLSFFSVPKKGMCMLLSPRGEAHYRLLAHPTARSFVVTDATSSITKVRALLRSAKPISRGTYRIVRRGEQTHLIYNVGRSGEVNTLIEVQKPRYGRGKDPGFPERLMRRFHDHAVTPVDPVAFLDYTGARIELAVDVHSSL